MNYNKIKREIDSENSNIKDIETFEDNNIVTPEYWEQELKEWKEMPIDEELAQKKSQGGDLLSDYKHLTAKWELENLFDSTLNIPDYLKYRVK